MVPFAHKCRSYAKGDRRSVTKLLAGLDRRYPGGLRWLNKRLNDIEVGHAYADLLTVQSRIVGVSIVTPKGARRAKLSTFFIHPAFRQHGLGTHLLKNLEHRWHRDSLDEVIVTIDGDDSSTIGFFSDHHFSLIHGTIASYGEERFDRILRWTAGDRASFTSLPQADLRQRHLLGAQTSRVSPRPA